MDQNKTKNIFKKLTIPFFLLIFGFIGLKFLAIDNPLFLIISIACIIGALVKLFNNFSKKSLKPNLENLNTENKSKLEKKRIFHSVIFLISGVVLLLWIFIREAISGCNESCKLLTVFTSVIFLMPLGIVFIIVGLVKLNKFLKNKKEIQKNVVN